MRRRIVVLVGLADLAGGRARAAGVDDLREGWHRFRAAEYAEAFPHLAKAAADPGLLGADYATYLAAESEFYAGRPAEARGRFEKLAAMKRSRFAAVAPWRAADCLWAAGKKDKAAAAYATLVRQKSPGGDAAVARFHLAEVEAGKSAARGKAAFLALVQDFPGHPLADEAGRRAAGKVGAQPPLSPRDRLKRADALTDARKWQEALDELARLPADLPEELRLDRDYQIGMTKFKMRRDYPKASELLLSIAPKLAGERAASALFHGARALSRVDRDDEAVAGYREVVRRHGSSRFAGEAQYLSGWLDFNRGRYRESIPALRDTVARFPSSEWADDAAWYVALAHMLLGESGQALEALGRYERIGKPGDLRVVYWRARLFQQIGRADEARNLLREVARRTPLSFYGLLARARLGQAGETARVDLPAADVPLGPIDTAAARDPAIARADELGAAGLDVEGGFELEREEGGVLKRLGQARGLAVVLDRYAALSNFRRAFRLAEGRPLGAALAAAPAGAARAIWQAAYPRAYAPLVDRYGPPAGSPDHFLYAVMRKESAFNPSDVSYADARGLLQMIPPTSAQVAEQAGLPFHPDELYDPETNIRLGAAYIGSLFAKFSGQIPVVAGAFNAGPKAMSRWCAQHKDRPMDEFVELIAFKQTREYAKLVTGIYARYRFLYGPTPFELPLTVDARVRPVGPDF